MTDLTEFEDLPRFVQIKRKEKTPDYIPEAKRRDKTPRPRPAREED